ncbi:RNA polymerase sigma factor 54 interaction domain protein [Acididesulfobacillus acetoxydans]|uniref:RNA polymerase sigma factor 54 interaction domain protein n=1 Tax=Acididesulfobacillus acetoxydans TaxID=1561005 RepID=A0A8S0X4S5_9FIRM|nr:sigma 54-interacting transcriptional regulator [Acididesulfobacillus acetoxydans]CAA7601050.1 RNA polymerase sigma factor 54 interaction domain protein [Acididesulfobacillus acetoxydans]CEJ06924.1 Signal-transduction and transcriptional-control protein [Acididesulfobacillus acetoxydans]
MVKLLSIQPFVQGVAEAIATALKLEVEIVDRELLRVAGTGRLRSQVGVKQKRGFVNRFVLKSGQLFLISDPGEHLICTACELKGNCFYTAGVFCPIVVDGTSIGLISLVSFSADQRTRLLTNFNDLEGFLMKMAELLAGKSKEEEIVRSLLITSNQMQTIVSSIQDGIVAVDQTGVVRNCNPAALRVLKTTAESVVGRRVQEILPEFLVCRVLKYNEEFVEQIVVHPWGKRRLRLLSSAFPVLVKGKLVGAVESFRPVADLQRVASRISEGEVRMGFSDILGESIQLKQLKEKAHKVAVGESTVLIEGESGTGKELFAQAIHTASSRAGRAFVAINCCAIPDNLLESELFGYEEGAFTGAKHGGKPGKFELANGGSIFLDEIGEMPLYLQGKLLRVLQERKLERVGGVRSIDLDVRVIAATNKDLSEMVAEGEFREDLYYRLQVIPLQLPPLRERKEDIPLLLEYFLARFNRLLGKEFKGFAPDSLALLRGYSWPGNIRELQNSVEYACNMETAAFITAESLPLKIRQFPRRVDSSLSVGMRLRQKMKEVEHQVLAEALEYFGSSAQGKEKIAEVLGISRATIYRKLKEHKLG